MSDLWSNRYKGLKRNVCEWWRLRNLRTKNCKKHFSKNVQMLDI